MGGVKNGTFSSGHLFNSDPHKYYVLPMLK